MINVRGFNNWATLTLHERWQWGLTSIYDGEGHNNWFLFYLGISGGDRSQLPNIQSKSNSNSDLTLEHGPHQATCYDFYPPRLKSYEPARERRGEERRGGVIMGAEESITQHYTGQTFSTVYTSSTNKVCSLSLGCSIAPCSSIWISWPSTTRRDCWTVFHAILSHCPTFSW